MLKDHVEDTEKKRLEELPAVKGPDADATNEVFYQQLISRLKFRKRETDFSNPISITKFFDDNLVSLI